MKLEEDDYITGAWGVSENGQRAKFYRLTRVKERWRETRPLRWLGGFGLDVKLGPAHATKELGAYAGRGPGDDDRHRDRRGLRVEPTEALRDG